MAKFAPSPGFFDNEDVLDTDAKATEEGTLNSGGIVHKSAGTPHGAVMKEGCRFGQTAGGHLSADCNFISTTP